jgi:hypothetical protein
MQKDFRTMFNSKEREALDQLINERLGQGSLVGKMHTEEEKKNNTEAKLLQWSDDFKKYPYLYVMLFVSALFTLTLGMMMGIAPKVDLSTMTVTYQTDGMHLFLAFVYMTAFVTVTEGAFAIAKWLYHTRENANKTQATTMLFMMGLAGISIVGTGIAGGMVVASNIAFLSAFIEIPASAQKWVIVVIPVLLAIYAFLLTSYALSSNSAKSERMLGQQKRTAELDHQTRKRSIMQIAEEELQVAELGRYLELVKAGRISAADARGAILAGRTLQVEETRQGRDIDGDGNVGKSIPAQSASSQPVRPVRIPYIVPEHLKPVPLSFRCWTLSEFLATLGVTADAARQQFTKLGIGTSSEKAWDYLNQNDLAPNGMDIISFEPIYHEIMGVPVSAFTPSPRTNGNHPS